MKSTSFQERIGLAMKKRREELDLTQENLAPLANMHRNRYGEIERGLIRIRIDTLEKLSLALNMRPWEILKEAETIQ